MIVYLIINKLGTIIYQSNTKTNTNENQRIRYLPLLVIKDLVKASFYQNFEYIKLQDKTIVFEEKQNLFYVACTKRNIPIHILQHHLAVIHSFLNFRFGPQWITDSSNKKKEIHNCLMKLPFIKNTKLSILSNDMMCYIEQVQIGEDLINKLKENMVNCCDHSFGMIDKPIFNKSVKTWEHCFLFAREKIIAQCSNSETLNQENLYFLKLLVSQLPTKMIASTSSHSNSSHHSNSSSHSKLSPQFMMNNNITLPKNINNQRSVYVYHSSSSSSPFKIREKSASSATLLSFESPYWYSSPEQQMLSNNAPLIEDSISSSPDSLKCLLTNLYNEIEEDVKVFTRYVNNQYVNIIVVYFYQEISTVIISKQDKIWNHQIKQFKASFKSQLSDFYAFLLTKESTHFTNLSFTLNFPGLIHFIYRENGILISPLLTDLNELDKNHELLYQVIYHCKKIDQKRKWPTLKEVRRMTIDLLHLGLSKVQQETRILKESNQFYLLYEKNLKNQELFCIYFNIFSKDRIWNIHNNLLNDLGQRTSMSLFTV